MPHKRVAHSGIARHPLRTYQSRQDAIHVALASTRYPEMQHSVVSVSLRLAAIRKADMDRCHRHLKEPVARSNVVLDQEVRSRT